MGIPDSLFGTAWPAIYTEFDLPISFASFVTVIISCGTVVSSMFSAKVINRFGTNKVSAFSTAMTAAALIGFSFSGNLWLLCLFAVPLGLGAGAIDTALNNYVAVHYSATHMSFLHCFYGIGVSVSPYIMSLVIGGKSGWRGGYQVAFIIQLCITLLLLFTLPIWKKVHPQTNEEQQILKTLTLKAILKIPGVKTMCCLFITTCAIEYTCGGWGSTFLVEYKHMAADQAAQMVMFYYIGIAFGRFLSGILATRLNSWQIIKIGQCVLGAALILLLLPLSPIIVAIGLFLIGLGNGSLFPNFNYLTPKNFGEDVSQSVMGTQMAASYVGIMIAPALCGILGQLINMSVFPVYLLVFYLIMIIATRKVKRVLNISGLKEK
ncbi:MAG: MFS transporter [Lachnospiraceae bacterium]|nr:MFS transporter [Lachnospiraceae bacterium]